MAVPAANSPRECTCVDDFGLASDEELVRCAHFHDWAVVLIETKATRDLSAMWTVESNVVGWGEFYSLDRAAAEESFAFAEGRFHEDGV